MSTSPIAAATIAMALLAGACSTSDPDPAAEAPPTSDIVSEARTDELSNGLDVIVTPIERSTGVAVALVFDIGSHHDPPGRSGLAHAVEHVFITAATDREPARSVDEYVRTRPLGWNAQTGEAFTVFASVVEPAQLDEELDLVAARLRGVRPTDSDLAVEEPRLEQELTNMFGAIPTLGAANLARERLRPTPHGGRRGGDPAHIATLTRSTIAERLELYHAGNAALSIAGDLDADEALDLVRERFGALPGGPPIGEPASPPNGPGGVAVVDLTGSVVDGSSQVAIAYPAPEAGSAEHAAFLVAVNRLFTSATPDRFTPVYAPLDDPAVLVITAPLPPDQDPTAAAANVHDAVTSILSAPLDQVEGGDTARLFGPLLALPGTGAPASSDPYGVAFGAARSAQLGIDPDRLANDLQATTDDDFASLTDSLAEHPVTGGAVLAG